jgi:hypothetical protein
MGHCFWRLPLWAAARWQRSRPTAANQDGCVPRNQPMQNPWPPRPVVFACPDSRCSGKRPGDPTAVVLMPSAWWGSWRSRIRKACECDRSIASDLAGCGALRPSSPRNAGSSQWSNDGVSVGIRLPIMGADEALRRAVRRIDEDDVCGDRAAAYRSRGTRRAAR